MLTIACDFDGTITERGALRIGAREALRSLKAAGHRLILHSCRCNPIDDSPEADLESAAFYRSGTVPDHVRSQWDRFREMREFLRDNAILDLFEVWQEPGKPVADLYVDDRAEPPSWQTIVAELGVR